MSRKKNSGSSSRCPICEQATDEAFKPFCSKRCANIDLHRWLSGSYTIPATEGLDPEEEDLPPAMH